MESFLTSYSEYHFLYVSVAERVESRSIQNAALLKLFFHPGADMSQAPANAMRAGHRLRCIPMTKRPPIKIGESIQSTDVRAHIKRVYGVGRFV
jgi:hypothetical protein